MDETLQAALRSLPSVDELVRQIAADAPRWAVVEAAREEIAALRAALLAGQGAQVGVDQPRLVRRARELAQPSLRRVFNASGVVLHTNLGRAPLATRALTRLREIGQGYSNLEYQLHERRRGSRHQHAVGLLRQLCGAEDALVVNNNAAAVLLVLSALAAGREVVVSRGELIEIGGSFRLPDVMTASGALLREVGTTNRTHLADYERAISAQTALLLKAHRSNFTVSGFVAEVDPTEMATLGKARAIPTVFDLGSGTLVRLLGELSVPEVLAAGFDLVTFSGDKLLGGPQAGVICGRRALISRLREHPLMRALRPDKLTLAALEATLELYRDGLAETEVPTLRMLLSEPSAIKQRAARLQGELQPLGEAGWQTDLTSVAGRAGGGALPGVELASWAVALRHALHAAEEIERRLRLSTPAVLGRIEDDALLLDARTVHDDELSALATAVTTALGGAAA